MTDETGFILAVTSSHATGFMLKMCTMSQRNLKSAFVTLLEGILTSDNIRE